MKSAKARSPAAGEACATVVTTVRICAADLGKAADVRCNCQALSSNPYRPMHLLRTCIFSVFIFCKDRVIAGTAIGGADGPGIGTGTKTK